MRSRRRRAARGRWSMRIATWLLAAATGLAAGRFGWRPVLEGLAPGRERAVTVSISGSRRVPPRELAGLAGLPAHVHLDQIDLDAVAQRIRRHPCVAEARATVLPPGRLLIGVEERTPRATTPIDDALYFVDGSGVAFARASESSPLPRIEGSEGVRLGEPDLTLVEGVQILDALAREGLPEPSRVEVGRDQKGLRPAFEWGGATRQRVVLGPGRLGEKLARLGRLLGAQLRETREAGRLDLRFAGRVVLRPREPGPREAASGGGPAGDPAPDGAPAPRETRSEGIRARAGKAPESERDPRVAETVNATGGNRRWHARTT